MNLGILKDALASLFDSKHKQVIALLLIVVGIMAGTIYVNRSTDEIKDEITTVEKDGIGTMKDIEANEEQIRALWVYIRRIENEHKDHITKRRH